MSLRARVICADDIAILINRGGAGHLDHIANPHGARVANNLFPRRAG